MLVRIVKLQFKEEKINDFLLHFETVKWEVTNFPGCRGMKLLQDLNTPSIIITYSVWDRETKLGIYDKKYIFLPETIIENNLIPIPEIGSEGVLHK